MNLTVVRTTATVGIAALTSLLLYYPHETWILAVLAVLGTVGIHAIPSVGQNKGVIMAEQLSGPELMGIPTVPVVTEPAHLAVAPASDTGDLKIIATPETPPTYEQVLAGIPAQVYKDAANWLKNYAENL